MLKYNNGCIFAEKHSGQNIAAHTDSGEGEEGHSFLPLGER